jgi:hypothetical protein
MMKRWVVGVLVLPVLVGTFPAYAVVDLTTVIFKEWDARIVETIAKVTRLDVAVTLVGPASGAAQAQTIVNQINGGNRMDFAREHEGFRNSVHGGPADRQAVITDSVNANNGIVGVNQNVGNMGNQANVVSMAQTPSSSSVAEAKAEAVQVNAISHVRHWENRPEDAGGLGAASYAGQSARISDSANDNLGIVGINQSVGNMNNQLNAVSMATILGSGSLLSNAALGQVIAGNGVWEGGTTGLNLISNSINNNKGIIGVNQSSGHLNNQANVVSVARTTPVEDVKK